MMARAKYRRHPQQCRAVASTSAPIVMTMTGASASGSSSCPSTAAVAVAMSVCTWVMTSEMLTVEVWMWTTCAMTSSGETG